MPGDPFKLPGASLEEVEKIVEAYSQKTGPASNDDIAQITGSSVGTVSRCNGFLVAVGLIEGGQKKEVTELGRKLGLALHHGQEGEVKKFWNEVVVGNEFLSEQVTAVRVQKAVKKDDLPSKILYNSGSKKNQYTEIGSRTVSDILVRAGLLADENGTYTVRKGAAAEPKADFQAENVEVPEETASTTEADQKVTHQLRVRGTSGVQLAVNLQIQIQEFEDTSKYEDLFRALRKHLLDSDPTG